MHVRDIWVSFVDVAVGRLSKLAVIGHLILQCEPQVSVMYELKSYGRACLVTRIFCS